MKRALAAAALGAALPGCTGPEPARPGPVEVRVAWDGGERMAGCRFEAEGRAMGQQALLAAARGWKSRGARVSAGADTPFKCIGLAIFTLQRAGIIGRIGLISEPPPPPAER